MPLIYDSKQCTQLRCIKLEEISILHLSLLMFNLDFDEVKSILVNINKVLYID